MKLFLLSSTNRARDYRYKHTEYAARGIAEYSIIEHPEMRQITICKWSDGMYEDTAIAGNNRIQSDVIPTLDLTADQLFSMGS